MSNIIYTNTPNPKARTAGMLSPNAIISLIKWYLDNNTIESDGASETDPIFTASPAFGITSGDVNDWLKQTDTDLLYEPKDANITKDNENEVITGAWDFPVGGIGIGSLELSESNLSDLYTTTTTVNTKEASWDAAAAFQQVGLVDDDFVPDTSTGILVRLTTAVAEGGDKGTYGVITDNSSNWNNAASHAAVVIGNPHDIGYADILDFSTGVSTYETSHANLTKSNVNENITGAWNFPTGGIDIGTQELSETNLASLYTTQSTVNSNKASWDAGAAFASVGLTDDDFDFGLGLMKRTAAGVYTIVTDNSSNWNAAYTDTNNATSSSVADRIVERDGSKNIYVNNVYFGV